MRCIMAFFGRLRDGVQSFIGALLDDGPNPAQEPVPEGCISHADLFGLVCDTRSGAKNPRAAEFNAHINNCAYCQDHRSEIELTVDLTRSSPFSVVSQ